MKKKVIIIAITAILTIGAVTAVYAKGNNTNNLGFTGTMMNENNINNGTYNKMIDIMKSNGFEIGAKAMERRDYKAMSNFMNSLTDNQYNQMINIMQNNGYESMAKRMVSVNMKEMINIHNSMMGR